MPSDSVSLKKEMYAKVVLPLILFASLDQSGAANYELVSSNDDLFTDCQGIDARFMDISNMFDFSHFNSTLTPDGMTIEEY